MFFFSTCCLSGFSFTNQQKFWQTDFCLWQKIACHRLIGKATNNLKSVINAACQTTEFSKSSSHIKTLLVSNKNTLIQFQCFACKIIASFVKLVSVALSKERVRLQNDFKTNSKKEDNLINNFINSKTEENRETEFSNSPSEETVGCKYDLISTNFSWLCPPPILPNSILIYKTFSPILWHLFFNRTMLFFSKLELWHSFSTFNH